jgi:hypothetical protein
MIQLVNIILITLPILLSADYTIADRQAGLRAPQVNNEESVSSEPLTFEMTPREPVDRWSLLREASVYVTSDDPNHAAAGRRAGSTGAVVAPHHDHGGAVSSELGAGASTTNKGGVHTVGESKRGDFAVARRLRWVDRSVVEGGRPNYSTEEIGQDHTNEVRIRATDESLSPPDDAEASHGRRRLCTNVKISFKVDKYGKETTVKLIGSSGTVLSSINEVQAYGTKTMSACVSDGTYTFKLTDVDGLCCSNGKGWYKLWAGSTLLVSGAYFIGSKAHTIKIGYDWQSLMDDRDTEWLRAHNSRRRTYNGGAGYKPLRWANSLARDAKGHAEYLANDCKNADLTHAKKVEEGENLAKNQGHGTWGGMYAADDIVGRWVEKELTWPYPSNAHYTQVVWRATSYVGCGESVRQLSDGASCRVQVCRYQPPGNCQVKNGNWKAEAWKDETGCGEQCPETEGCYN